MNRSISNVELSAQTRNAIVLTRDMDIRPMNAINFNYSGNRIVRIDENAFKKYKHLEKINLSNNEIEEIPDDVFDENTEIKSINLTNNRLRDINRKVFSRLRQLHRLNLSLNRIDRIEFFCIYSTSLMELNLSNNNIVFVHKLAFFHMPNLKILKLAKNRIKTMELYAYFLLCFDLEDNRIKDLNAGLFFWHRDMKCLNLLRNRIEKIPTDTFKHVVSLEHLKIEVNDSFDFASIDHLTRLKTFKLLCHGYQSFTYQCLIIHFLNKPIITKLHLGYRSLNIYCVQCICGLVNLRCFHLECFEPNAFKERLKLAHFCNHPSLEVVHFVRLNTYHIENHANATGISKVKELFLVKLFNVRIATVLSGFRYLEHLDLSYSKLEHISPINFKHLAFLKYLSLEYSALCKIATNTFRYNSLLTVLLLRNCFLSKICLSIFRSPLAIQILDIRNNPIEYISRYLYDTIKQSGTLLIDDRVPVI